MLPLNTVLNGHVLDKLRILPDESVDVVVTSPPYWGLRDYGADCISVWGGSMDCCHEWQQYTYYSECVKCGAWRGQFGLEPHPQMYIDHLLQVTAEVKRVLKKTGSFWLNLGDTYFGGNGKIGRPDCRADLESDKLDAHAPDDFIRDRNRFRSNWLQPRQKLMIPARVAIAMQEQQGWILRNEIVWHKCLSGNTPVYALSNMKVLRSSIRELARLPLENLYLPCKNGWVKVLSIKQNPPSEMLTFHLRNGSKFKVTFDHEFLVKGITRKAATIKKYEVLDGYTLPDFNGTELGTPENGWIVGLFLAEGNYESDRFGIRFSLHEKEVELGLKIEKFAKKYAGFHRRYFKGNKRIEIIEGYVPYGIIKHYVEGKGAKQKHISRHAFNENNAFLKALLDGFLSGDGYFDQANNRWKFAISANRELEYDLKTICARLGLFMRSRYRKARCNNKEYSCMEIEIREKRTGHHNQKDDREIMRITHTKGISYAVEVAGDKTFLLYDGTITHNCNHMPESVANRFTRSWESVFFFVKSPKYFFDLDAVRKPVSEATLKRQRYPHRGSGDTSVSVSRPRAPGEFANPLGANPGDVWSLTNKGLREEHYAAYPTTLVERILLASAPREICDKCGEPKRRVTVKVGYDGDGGKQVERKIVGCNGLSESSIFRTNNCNVIREFAGWCGCDCNAGFHPAVVLDPFAGAGSTLVVAHKLGLNWVGIELVPKYCDIINKRVAELGTRLDEWAKA